MFLDKIALLKTSYIFYVCRLYVEISTRTGANSLVAALQKSQMY